jgi:hypothetical protein
MSFEHPPEVRQHPAGESGGGQAQEQWASECKRASNGAIKAPNDEDVVALRVQIDAANGLAGAERAGGATRDGKAVQRFPLDAEKDGLAAAKEPNAKAEGCGENAVRGSGDPLRAGDDLDENGGVKHSSTRGLECGTDGNSTLGVQGLHLGQVFVRRARAALSRRSGRATGQTSCTKPLSVFTRLSRTWR